LLRRCIRLLAITSVIIIIIHHHHHLE